MGEALCWISTWKVRNRPLGRLAQTTGRRRLRRLKREEEKPPCSSAKHFAKPIRTEIYLHAADWDIVDLREALEESPKQRVKLLVVNDYGDTWNLYKRRREVMAAVTALAYCAAKTRMKIKVRKRFGKCKRLRVKVKVY